MIYMRRKQRLWSDFLTDFFKIVLPSNEELEHSLSFPPVNQSGRPELTVQRPVTDESRLKLTEFGAASSRSFNRVCSTVELPRY